MMRGTKRLSGSDSNPLLNDSLFQGKRVFGGWKSDRGRPESSQAQLQQVSALPLDMQRAELSRQHVRALNTQFASWVQSQLQNHPDELWQDGAQDYLNHASNIMEKFADVVNWLKENVKNGETGLISGSERKNIETNSKESIKSTSILPSLTGTTGSLFGFGDQNNMVSNSRGVDKPSSGTSMSALGGATTVNENNKSGGALPSTTGIFGGSGGLKSSESKQIGNNLSSDKENSTPASTIASFGSTTPSFGGTALSFGGTASSLGGTTPSFGGTAASYGSTIPSFGGSGGAKSSESKRIGDDLLSAKSNSSPPNTTASFGSTAASFGGAAASFGGTAPSFGGTTPSFGGTTPSFGGTAANFGGTTPSFGGSGGPKSSESKQIGNNLTSDKANSTPASSTASFGGTTPSFGGTTPSFGGTTPSFGGKTPSFGGTTSSFGLSSGTSFNNSPFSFGIQTSVASSQISMPTTNNAANEEEDGEEADEQPGSPSVKKTEEKGVIVVHEVKCKLYVKSTDPANAWKDKGTGQLSIKCLEGIAKGTKESKPTIILRNDVGKVALNALLYPGIKTTLQKNAVVAIFHSSGDGDDSESVVARTFLLRTKSVEDRDKLDAAIKAYAPSA